MWTLGDRVAPEHVAIIDDGEKRCPSLTILQFFTLFKRGEGGQKPAEFTNVYGNGIRSAIFFYQMFKGKGGEVLKGVLNNVRKPARLVETDIPNDEEKKGAV